MRSNLTINISVVCSLAFFFNSCAQKIDFSQKEIIKLQSHNIINESGCGDALLLIDEFDKEPFMPQTFWFPKERSICEDETASVVFKLDAQADVKQIHIFAESSCEGSLASYGKTFEPIKISLGSGWNSIEFRKKTEYVKFEVLGSAKISELVMEGSYGKVLQKSAPPLTRPSFNEFMGVNAFVDAPMGALEVVQNVREYHESSWHQKDSSDYNFAPSYPGFEFELFYQNMARSKSRVVPVLQHSAFWLTSDKNTEVKPLPRGSNTTDPGAYVKHGELLYHFVKNYKEKGVALPYLENWNEPDKWWHGNTAYMAPYEYAAMSSQDWDAQQDTSKPSIYKANAGTQMVMAGLSDLKSDYVNALRYWCDQHRGGNVPWKVVNAHVYAQDLKAKKALSPEAFALDEKVAAFVANSKIAMPEAEVWLSEFGYDRNGDSPQSVPVIKGYTAEEVQAIWLLRSFLLLSSTGLDKAFQYMIRDTKGKGLYTSSGLYKLGNTQIVLLESWYYLKTLRNTLGDYHFVKRIPTDDKDFYVYEFENLKSQKAYAVWIGVADRKTLLQQKLELPLKSGSKLTLVAFDKSFNGVQKAVTYNANFKLDITEKPILLLETAPAILESYIKVPALELVLDKEATLLFDEQQSHDPLLYTQTKPISTQESKTVTVPFVNALALSHVCLFDDQGQSEISLEVLIDNNWTLIYQGKLSMYQKWKTVVVGKLCKGLRISHKGNTSKIGELVLYQKK